MESKPIIIRKTAVGLLAIYLVAALAFVLLAVAAILTGLHSPTGLLAAIGAVATLVAAYVAAYVYSESYVELTDVGMTVVNYRSLFSDLTAECAYDHIEDIDVRKNGLFSFIFGYGTLYVQTAGTERNLKLPLIPNVEHWRDEIARRADTAATLVRET